MLENITSTASYNQTVNKLTRFTNVSSSCIDLIFASNTTYLNTGIEQSVYDKFHDNIKYEKLNFDIYLPPPYYRKLWDYKKAGTEAMQRAIFTFNHNLGGLFSCSFSGVSKIIPCLKPIRIMLETSNLARK